MVCVPCLSWVVVLYSAWTSEKRMSVLAEAAPEQVLAAVAINAGVEEAALLELVLVDAACRVESQARVYEAGDGADHLGLDLLLKPGEMGLPGNDGGDSANAERDRDPEDEPEPEGGY